MTRPALGTPPSSCASSVVDLSPLRPDRAGERELDGAVQRVLDFAPEKEVTSRRLTLDSAAQKKLPADSTSQTPTPARGLALEHALASRGVPPRPAPAAWRTRSPGTQTFYSRRPAGLGASESPVDSPASTSPARDPPAKRPEAAATLPENVHPNRSHRRGSPALAEWRDRLRRGAPPERPEEAVSRRRSLERDPRTVVRDAPRPPPCAPAAESRPRLRRAMSARVGSLGRPLPILTGRSGASHESTSAAGIRSSASRVKNELSDLLAATKPPPDAHSSYARLPPHGTSRTTGRRPLPPRSASYASLPQRQGGWLPRRESAARLRRAAASRAAAAAAPASLRNAVLERSLARSSRAPSEAGEAAPPKRQVVEPPTRRQFSEVSEEVVAL